MHVFASIRWMFSWLFIVKLRDKENVEIPKKLSDWIIITIGIFFFLTMYIGNLIYVSRYLTKDFANALLAVFVSCALTTGVNTFVVGTFSRKRINKLLQNIDGIYTKSEVSLTILINNHILIQIVHFHLDEKDQNLLFEYLKKADERSEFAGKCCIYWITFFACYSVMCVLLNIAYSLMIDGHIIFRHFFPYRML